VLNVVTTLHCPENSPLTLMSIFEEKSRNFGIDRKFFCKYRNRNYDIKIGIEILISKSKFRCRHRNRNFGRSKRRNFDEIDLQFRWKFDFVESKKGL
jgi:hypothetical protein